MLLLNVSGKDYMDQDQAKSRVLRIQPLGKSLKRVRNTHVLGPKETVRTVTIEIIVLGMIETRNDLGMTLLQEGLRKSSDAISAISQDTTPLVALNVRSLGRPKYSRLIRNIHLLAPRIVLGQEQNHPNPRMNQETLVIL